MNLRNNMPRRPIGDDEGTKFFQAIWDRVYQELQFIDSPTVKWKATTRGMVGEAVGKALATSSAGGRVRGYWDADAVYNDGDIVLNVENESPAPPSHFPEFITYQWLAAWVYLGASGATTEPSIFTLPLNPLGSIAANASAQWSLICATQLNFGHGFTGQIIVKDSAGNNLIQDWVGGRLMVVNGFEFGNFP